MSVVALYRIDPVQNMERYYTLAIQRDLFAAWCVVTEWGRIGRNGQKRCAAYPNEAQAVAALVRAKVAKEKRGYARLIT